MTISSELPLSIWRPDLAAAEGPAYARIVDALAADIDRGALPRGARLPTQRALAEAVGVGIGTVTRAYAEAEARGLIDAVVGRGSFVARSTPAPHAEGAIDLSRNVAPMAPAVAALRGAMAALAKRSDLAQRLDYAPDAGFPADRRAGAEWLRRAANLDSADERRLIVTAGAQQGIAVALTALCRPGDALIVEAATFNGVKLIATQLGLRVISAVMDGEGLTAAALERAATSSGGRVAYLQPFQNPTARVMGLPRRREIVEAARRVGVTLIEDDLYGPHVAELDLPPLADLAPDQVAYVSGLSKSLAPGVRTGFLIPPDRNRTAALDALRGAAFGPPTLGAVLATQWIESGAAFEVFGAIQGELRRRTSLAKTALAGFLEPLAHDASPHVWLPMGELDAERVAGQALRAGVKVTPPRAPFVDGDPVDGLRVCLGAAPDLATLERGLGVLRSALAPGPAPSESVV
ncbi:MAG TPA: PLP-dependent aminotransferase family protein [Caulobacteraceae bacterium]|jgi:DNA-binding transcriptional MocR family regulator|nr:PLP-dependent aminotransferase family protein [Caulobacteraceae bacterium]